MTKFVLTNETIRATSFDGLPTVSAASEQEAAYIMARRIARRMYGRNAYCPNMMPSGVGHYSVFLATAKREGSYVRQNGMGVRLGLVKVS